MIDASLPELINELADTAKQFQKLATLSFEMYQEMQREKMSPQLRSRYLLLIAGRKS